MHIPIKIKCPYCRKMCPLPNANVDDLPESFLYNQLIEAHKPSLSAKNTKKCRNSFVTFNICSSIGCGQNAHSFCKTCKYICCDCEYDHKTVSATKSHVILTISEAETLQKMRYNSVLNIMTIYWSSIVNKMSCPCALCVKLWAIRVISVNS